MRIAEQLLLSGGRVDRQTDRQEGRKDGLILEPECHVCSSVRSNSEHITLRYNSKCRSSRYLFSAPSAVHHCSAAVTRQLMCRPFLCLEQHRRCVECHYFIYKSKPEKIYGNLTTLTTNSTPENQGHAVALRCKPEGHGFGSRRNLWNFSLTILPAVLQPWGLLSL
jgi:hypothetical protein